jgi:hypothetical protein
VVAGTAKRTPTPPPSPPIRADVRHPNAPRQLRIEWPWPVGLPKTPSGKVQHFLLRQRV